MAGKYVAYFEFVEWFESILREGGPVTLVDHCVISLSPEPRTLRLPLILRHESINSIEKLQIALDEPHSYGIILMQAGRASLALGCGDEILCSKQIQKYMVRKTQGKSQLTYLHQKGKSRLGSRIRLRQAAEFFSDINRKWTDWNSQFEVKQLFLSCTPKLKGFWFQASGPQPFAKKDPRWRRIPYQVRLPSQVELARIHRLLCRATWEDSLVDTP